LGNKAANGTQWFTIQISLGDEISAPHLDTLLVSGRKKARSGKNKKPGENTGDVVTGDFDALCEQFIL
jgi:hypothetical protein